MITLLSTIEAKNLGRQLGDIKDTKILSYIMEVENTQIKQALGDTLFMQLHNDHAYPSDEYDMLLSGGEYQDRNGNARVFSGLKTAIAYLVYIKVLMSGDIESTRYGFVVKEGQYSQHISNSARSAAYNDAMEVAKIYLRECVEYCYAKGLIKTNERRKGAAAGGCVIRKIG